MIVRNIPFAVRWNIMCTVYQVSSIAAHDAAVATGAMPQILLWVSAFEAISSVAVVQMLEGSGRAPGDFGFDPYNLYSKPGMEKKKVRCVVFCWLPGSPPLHSVR